MFQASPALAAVACLLMASPALAAPDVSFRVQGAAPLVPSVWEWCAFYALGSLALICAVLMITRRNPIVAALYLVGTLAATAGLYVLLQAGFLAAVQLLVYAGAIVVLFVFVVMAVERPDDEELGLTRHLGVKLLGGVAIVALLVRIIAVLLGPEVHTAPTVVSKRFGTVARIGELLFADYLLPFEVLSLLLLVAIVGAVVVSRRSPGDDASSSPNRSS